MKKIYVLDTSVCLSDSNCIFDYDNNDVIIPLKVLEEIDGHKKRQDAVGAQARSVIRLFDELREKGSLQKGVRLGKGKGILKVAPHGVSDLPDDLNCEHNDHIIISTALAEKNSQEKRKVILVSRDINMRVIADSIGVLAEDYDKNQAIRKESELYSGFVEHLVDEQMVDQFYSGESVFIDKEEKVGLLPNQFIMLVSNTNEKKTALCRFLGYMWPLQKVQEYKQGLWGVRARNKEQSFALDLLMDPDVQIVSLIGKAGSGKTLLAIAAGLEQVVSNQTVMSAAFEGKISLEGEYKRLIVSRPVQPMGKDIGFLPGTMEDKMKPWLAPIEDNLKFLTGDDNSTLEMYMEKGIIEMEALTYIRGRSIANSFIIIDEAQNLSRHEVKTILTRAGEGTKIVLTGDVEQIDNIYINETSTGLVHAVERLKRFDIAGHVTLKKGERSKLATVAAKNL
jgi:PhoH-like ATPase